MQCNLDFADRSSHWLWPWALYFFTMIRFYSCGQKDQRLPHSMHLLQKCSRFVVCKANLPTSNTGKEVKSHNSAKAYIPLRVVQLTGFLHWVFHKSWVFPSLRGSLGGACQCVSVPWWECPSAQCYQAWRRPTVNLSASLATTTSFGKISDAIFYWPCWQ